MGAVQFLLALLACDVNLCAVGRHNIVATVGGRIKDGFMLAHQGDGYAGCKATEGAFVAGDVDMMPCACIGKACLHNVSVNSDGLCAEEVCDGCIQAN